MVRHSDFRWLVALLALGWAWPVAADAIVPNMPGAGIPSGTGVSPLFVSSPFRLEGKGDGRALDLWAGGPNGALAMRAAAEV